jgi:hypothetical protein
MKRIYADGAACTSVYVDDDGAHYLYTMCSNVGWFSYCIRMTDEEVRRFREASSFATQLSAAVCRDWGRFSDRQLPDEFPRKHGFAFS